MQTYIIRRLLFFILVLFGVSVLVFGILSSFSPERRAAAFITSPQQAENIEELIEKYGFNDPIYIQYFRWVKEIGSGNMGYSLIAAAPVTKAFKEYLPATIELNLYAIPLFIMVGIWLGSLSGIKRNTIFDHITRIMAVVAWSLPTFLFALILLMIFYGYLGSYLSSFDYINILGYEFDAEILKFEPGILSDKTNREFEDNTGFVHYTSMVTIDAILNGRLDIFWDGLRHLILPVMTQVIVIIAVIIRVMRSSMIEEISKDYVITAKAKGADKKTIYMKHAKKNALLPVITVSGQLAAAVMEGSIAVEIIFSRKGICWWFAESAIQLDVPAVMGMCLFMAIIYVTTNLIVDLLYAYIDPRIRLN